MTSLDSAPSLDTWHVGSEGEDGDLVALTEVQLVGEISGVSCHIEIIQIYQNRGEEPIDTTLTFPMSSYEQLGVVCDLQVEFGGNVIDAEVLPIDDARQQFSIFSADVLQELSSMTTESTSAIAVGNLLPGQEVIIRFTFITTLRADPSGYRLMVPASFAPYTLFSVELDVEVSEQEITGITSPTHDVNSELRWNQWCVTYREKTDIDGDFVLVIETEADHESVSMVEKDGKDDLAAICAFRPEFEYEIQRINVTLLIDNTCPDTTLVDAKDVATRMLRSMSKGVAVNLLFHGEQCIPTLEYENWMSLTKQKKRLLTSVEAVTFQENPGASLLDLLEHYFDCLHHSEVKHELVLISDGQTPFGAEVLEFLAKQQHRSRVFCLGVGFYNHSFLDAVARCSGGKVEYIRSAESAGAAVSCQARRILQPERIAHFEWCSLNPVLYPIAQWDAEAVFSGELVFVLGFLPAFTEPMTVTLTLQPGGETFSHVVNPQSYLKRDIIGLLTTGALMRDMRDNAEPSEDIVRMSCARLVPFQHYTALAASFSEGESFVSMICLPDANEREVVLSPVRSPRVEAHLEQDLASTPPKKTYDLSFLLAQRPDIPTRSSQLKGIDILSQSPARKRRGKRGKRSKNSASNSPRLSHSNGRSPRSAFHTKGSSMRAPKFAEMVELKRSDNAWKPTTRGPGASKQQEELDVALKKFRGILNKVTEKKVDKFIKQILQDVKVSSAAHLQGLIKLIFEKVLSDQSMTPIYAILCFKLSKLCGTFPDPAGGDVPLSFRRLLLNRCQSEFESKDTIDESGDLTSAERLEREFKLKRRILGNIKFVGELFLRGLLTDGIMKGCIVTLLPMDKIPDSEDLEVLCRLLTTTGALLDRGKDATRKFLAMAMGRIAQLSENKTIENRLRFMLCDLIDLRANRWKDPTVKPKRTTSRFVEQRAVLKKKQQQGKKEVHLRNVKNVSKQERAAQRRSGRLESGGVSILSRKSGTATTNWADYNSPVVSKKRIARSVPNSRPAFTQSAAAVLDAGLDDKEEEEEQQQATSPSMRPKRNNTTQLLMSATADLLSEYISSYDADEACECVREFDSPAYHHRVINQAAMMAFEKGDKVRGLMQTLFKKMIKTALTSESELVRALVDLTAELSQLHVDFPRAVDYVAFFICQCLNDGLYGSLKQITPGFKKLAAFDEGKLVMKLMNQIVNSPQISEETWSQADISFSSYCSDPELYPNLSEAFKLARTSFVI